MADTSSFWDRLYAEVRAFRAELPDDAGPKDRGFAVLYNPPAPGELLVMGLHPRRRDAADARGHAAAEQGPPAEHLNISDRGGDLLGALRELLVAAELEPAESEAVWRAVTGGNKTNLWLFGASGPEEWESEAFWGERGAALRAEVEAACLRWHGAMMQVLQPAGLLFEGLASYSHLADHWGDRLEEHALLARTEGKGRLAVEGRVLLDDRALPVLAMRHPSSCWVLGAEDRRLLGQALARFCRQVERA
jgi:hypothetical protein